MRPPDALPRSPATPGTCRTASLRPLGLGWTALLAAAGAAAAWFGAASGRAPVFGSLAWWLICAAPALLGALLATTGTGDRQQYLARGLAASLMAPIGLAMWAATADGPPTGPLTWALGGALLLGGLLGWLALLAWAAQRATRLLPAAGTPVLDAARLRQRLAALQRGGAPMTMVADAPGLVAVQLQVDPAGQRAHWVRLHLDPARHTVTVVEQLGAQGAVPLADERSLRRPGDPLVDASRPDAQRVSGRLRQTTMLDASALADWPLQWSGDGLPGEVTQPPGWASADAVGRGRLGVALLAAVVLGCGWVWQPRLWAGLRDA